MLGDGFGLAVGVEGVLVRLLGELVGGEVISLAVRGCSGCVGVGCEVVIFGGAIVWALRHLGSPCCFMRLDASLRGKGTGGYLAWVGSGINDEGTVLVVLYLRHAAAGCGDQSSWAKNSQSAR